MIARKIKFINDFIVSCLAELIQGCLRYYFVSSMLYLGFPGGASGKESSCQCRRHKRHGFSPFLQYVIFTSMGFPGGSDGEESFCQCKRPRFHPWVRRSPGEGHGYPLQYSCLGKCTEESGGLQSMGPQRVRHCWARMRACMHALFSEQEGVPWGLAVDSPPLIWAAWHRTHTRKPRKTVVQNQPSQWQSLPSTPDPTLHLLRPTRNVIQLVKKILLECNVSPCCISFCPTAKWIGYTVYLYLLFSSFLFHTGHNRVLSRVSCTTQ